MNTRVHVRRASTTVVAGAVVTLLAAVLLTTFGVVRDPGAADAPAAAASGDGVATSFGRLEVGAVVRTSGRPATHDHGHGSGGHGHGGDDSLASIAPQHRVWTDQVRVQVRLANTTTARCCSRRGSCGCR